MNIKINGYELDKQQSNIVYDNSKYLLVVAGAGSGKTLTILGKIFYLINEYKINKNEILCISFTKASSDSLKEKVKKEFSIDIPVYTFHKLSLEILKEKDNSFEITATDTLDNIIEDFFNNKVSTNERIKKLILKYFNKSTKYNYEKLLSEKELENLKKLISTFIHLFKCNNYQLKDFLSFSKKINKTLNYPKYKREKTFLILTLNIYLEYENYLFENNELDFDDLILKATSQVKKYGINKKYKYIIIDEYQDTSLIRFNLIKEIITKTGANLMVVGDDFQSIYRFTGCDIYLFLDFRKYFKDAKIMKIENTYRNSQELIKVAGSFVMKNKNQLPKNLHSNKHLSKPIEIIRYKNRKKAFKKLIEQVHYETKKAILILGRNNKDIHNFVDNSFEITDGGKLIYKNNENIDLKYMTIHKSKGLEEENVIIINLENDILGFPSKLKDNNILRLISKYEKYPYSEERRLFYVALTRTKNKVYLFVPYKNESIFIKELLNNYKKNIKM